MDTNRSEPTRRFRLEVIDLAGLVLGYAMAALLFRAFWPRNGMSPALGLFAMGFYLWLGLAMSGPLLLLRHGSRTARDRATPSRSGTNLNAEPGRSWAELSWLLIGVYWIVMGVFVLPIRIQNFRFGDTILFGLVPVLGGITFRLFGPKNKTAGGISTSWTHQAAIALLATWPIAWLCLIVIGQSLL
jgi:hypothetical protein